MHHFKWLCIFISIGATTALFLPYPVSLLLGIGGFLVLNGIKNRLKISTTTDRLIKPNLLASILLYSPPTQDQQSIIYVCINCNIVHTKYHCPRCKSKLKRRL